MWVDVNIIHWYGAFIFIRNKVIPRTSKECRVHPAPSCEEGKWRTWRLFFSGVLTQQRLLCCLGLNWESHQSLCEMRCHSVQVVDQSEGREIFSCCVRGGKPHTHTHTQALLLLLLPLSGANITAPPTVCLPGSAQSHCHTSDKNHTLAHAVQRCKNPCS